VKAIFQEPLFGEFQAVFDPFLHFRARADKDFSGPLLVDLSLHRNHYLYRPLPHLLLPFRSPPHVWFGLPLSSKSPSRESAPENDGKIHLKAASQKGTRIAKSSIKQGVPGAFAGNCLPGGYPKITGQNSIYGHLVHEPPQCERRLRSPKASEASKKSLSSPYSILQCGAKCSSFGPFIPFG